MELLSLLILKATFFIVSWNEQVIFLSGKFLHVLEIGLDKNLVEDLVFAV